jgi:hypothetical protein
MIRKFDFKLYFFGNSIKNQKSEISQIYEYSRLFLQLYQIFIFIVLT